MDPIKYLHCFISFKSSPEYSIFSLEYKSNFVTVLHKRVIEGHIALFSDKDNSEHDDFLKTSFVIKM